jgi:hypothetical protein
MLGWVRQGWLRWGRLDSVEGLREIVDVYKSISEGCEHLQLKFAKNACGNFVYPGTDYTFQACYRRAAEREEVNITRSAHAVLSTTVKNISPLYAQYEQFAE